MVRLMCPSPAAPPADPPNSAPALPILVVDPNRDCADSLALLLRLWGYTVEVAYTAADAVRLAVTRPPAVVLADASQPDAPDARLPDRLRMLPGRPVLVALTTLGPGLSRPHLAAYDFRLTKPLDPDFLQRLLRALATRRLGSALLG